MLPNHYNLLDTAHGDFVLNAAAIAAIMSIGNSFFVNETTGDDANPGSSAAPFKTLTAALAACTANNNDVIYLKGTVHISATLAWNKANVSLVGIDPPCANNRSRISQTGSGVFSPLVLVSVSDCNFKNIGTFHGFDDASDQICWEDTGGRNSYANCDFFGMGHATAAAQAGSRSFLMSGSTGETLFDGCTFGLDTIVRATNANATLEFAGGSPRNVIRGSIFRALVSDAADVHIKIGAAGIDRDLLIDDTAFMNAIDSTGTAMTAAIVADAAAGGSVVLMPSCISVGATHFAQTGGPVYISGAVPTAGTSQIGIKAT